MDKKAKYYKAVNYMFNQLNVFGETSHFSKFLDDFYGAIDGIVEVLAYDTELSLQEKMKVVNYFHEVRTKASKLPR